MDKAQMLVLASCPPAVGWLWFHDVQDGSRSLPETAWPVVMSLAACICGTVSAIADREGRSGGAWSVVGWTTLICYAGMLSACTLEQARVFAFGHAGLPTWVGASSMAIGIAVMFTGLIAGILAFVALPVLVSTLLYIMTRSLRGRTT